MTERKLSLWLLPFIILTSFVRHSIWLGFNGLTLSITLLEVLVPLLTFLILFLIHNLTASIWPLRIWLIYAGVVIVLKLVDLQFLIDILY